MRLIDADKIEHYECRGKMSFAGENIGEQRFILIPIAKLTDIPTVEIDKVDDTAKDIISEIQRAEQNYYFNQCWNYDYLIEVINRLISLSKKVEV